MNCLFFGSLSHNEAEFYYFLASLCNNCLFLGSLLHNEAESRKSLIFPVYPPLKAENPIFADTLNVLNDHKEDPHHVEHLSLA